MHIQAREQKIEGSNGGVARGRERKNFPQLADDFYHFERINHQLVVNTHLLIFRYSNRLRPLARRSFLHPYFFCFRFGGFCPPGFEFFHSSGRIDQLLFTRIERMALIANFHFYLRLGRANRKTIAAGAMYFGCLIILWMYFWFHKNLIPVPILHLAC